ncbi:MAG: hypothetical protein FJW69_01975 [Actinobacteria bacterium]|nr:hypothetical protein [Actinomycetota bacterium]MBM3712801.1 hypothetical protein [Actinomycetota bacterium]
MYKCKKCGNVEKFIGSAEEKGNVFIFQENISDIKKSSLSWIYSVSDGSWNGNVKIHKCFYCSSKEISTI